MPLPPTKAQRHRVRIDTLEEVAVHLRATTAAKTAEVSKAVREGRNAVHNRAVYAAYEELERWIYQKIKQDREGLKYINKNLTGDMNHE